jgi:predicted phage gp36 major capsid-like protein
VELIPHLFGENRRPTGQRGWFAHWRVGGAPVVPGAFRRLEVAGS